MDSTFLTETVEVILFKIASATRKRFLELEYISVYYILSSIFFINISPEFLTLF